MRDAGVGRALSLMHAHPTGPWTREDLAAKAGLSR